MWFKSGHVKEYFFDGYLKLSQSDKHINQIFFVCCNSNAKSKFISLKYDLHVLF